MKCFIVGNNNFEVKMAAVYEWIKWSRVDEVVKLLLRNKKYLESNRGDELRKRVAKMFNLSERSAHDYINLAKEDLRKMMETEKEMALQRALLDREYLIDRAKGIKGKDGKYAVKPNDRLLLEVLKDREKLLGLYVDAVKNDVTVKNVDLSCFTEEGLAELAKGRDIFELMGSTVYYKPKEV